MEVKRDISESVEVLRSNLNQAARVSEWAELMGYNCPKKFARQFLRHYYERPQSYLTYIRLKSIVEDLRKGHQSNFRIAIEHGIPDEIALNKFVNYHMGCSPTCVKNMSDNEMRVKLENFGSKVR
jgi:methylphosphotriester-DNA--protein-cysteine methyltransferase